MKIRPTIVVPLLLVIVGASVLIGCAAYGVPATSNPDEKLRDAYMLFERKDRPWEKPIGLTDFSFARKLSSGGINTMSPVASLSRVPPTRIGMTKVLSISQELLGSSRNTKSMIDYRIFTLIWASRMKQLNSPNELVKCILKP